jgi:DDE superfamily endonuclease
MASHHPSASTALDPHLVPPILAVWLSGFRPGFTAPVWNRILVLVAGAVLAPGKRTVSQLLRVMGLADEPSFRRYHEVLSRARWDGRAVARRLLLTIVEQLLPDGEVVIGIDDTIEGCVPGGGVRGRARSPWRSAARGRGALWAATADLR